MEPSTTELHPEKADFGDSVSLKPRVLMWCLLGVVVMTFSGLIGAYVVIATNSPIEWKPLDSLPFQVWISTAIILASSISYHLAKKALDNGRDNFARWWFLATGVMGAAFISSQLVVWLTLINRGFYMKGNPYVGFFYILTAVHAIHVFGGVIALGYIHLKMWNRNLSAEKIRKRKMEAAVIGWYWHTMGGLWLILLFLLAFWN